MARHVTDAVTPTDPLWKLTPYVDRPGEYEGRGTGSNGSVSGGVAGDFRFDRKDVALLFMLQGLHAPARTFFAEVEESR
jgi:hypothetical protein